MPSPHPEDWPIHVEQIGVKEPDRAPVDPDYAPEFPVEVAKAPKAILNGHTAKITSKSSCPVYRGCVLIVDPNQLRYLARVVRSKNSGPFEITCDVSRLWAHATIADH